MKPTLAILAAALLIPTAALANPSGPSAAPTHVLSDNGDGTCGTIKLILKNPDLQERADGFIYASGLFFIQFQAVGSGAEQVKTFKFSFGKALPDGTAQCSTPRWVTGAYIPDYRGDYTPDDGFFIPLNTTLVRDDEYGAAVHAYNSADVEIARFYAKAKVQNGCVEMQCRDKSIAQRVAMDKIMPWPRVLPGDGVQSNSDVNGLTIEFAEPIKSVEAFINGNQTPLQKWQGVMMDDDVIPGNDHQPCGSIPSQVCTKRYWGPAYKWEGAVRQNDVIRVVATDLNDNRVDRIIHLLDPSQGGIVTGGDIDVDISVDTTTVSVGAGQQGEFKFNFVSLASEDAHVNLPVVYDESQLDAKFVPNHIVVKAGGRATATLVVAPKEGVTSGTFLLNAKPNWNSAGKEIEKEFPLSFIVGSGEGGNLVNNQTNQNATGKADGDGAGTPGLGALATLGVLAVATVGALRRRR